ncbi:mechanosensitive ion channel domain-containing protein [Azonexus sp.]|uniref:mechanosensitive ion channel family protein n=1 Tax=Azonexus sp. TaxID=1872668 RepID=UPI002834E78B|nr:mechanosensitive ion channel domain-containing protein [Azonexus sp.]MDR1995838.1 mechanosensitive ion channel [Azonexus sp.]
MNRDNDPALSLLRDIWADVQAPGFIWQLATLATCLGLALLFARWWQRRQVENAGRFGQASARLAFPLSGLLLVGLALPLLTPFIKVNLLKLALPLLSTLALVRAVVFVLRHAFPKTVWLTTWERIITTLVWGWLALYIAGLAPYVIDALQGVQFSIGVQRVDLWMILHGVVTVFLTLVVALWVAGLIERRLMRMADLDSSLRIVGIRFAKAVLTLLAIMVSLSLVGIDMTALSVFTGALGVGLGFGLQKIASNYVSGFIILLDRSIHIGNIIQVGTDAGEVRQITTRYTVLKHPGGTEFIVPNETLISSTVQNQTYSDRQLRLATTIGVAYDSDLDLVTQLMLEAAKTQPRVLAKPPPRVTLTEFADNSINLELGFWIADPEAGKGNVVSDINFAVWRAFKAHGVQIPFPQREVRILHDAAAPANAAN